jgi:predicted flap endonuclease-1-like 5' DNA nuclease
MPASRFVAAEAAEDPFDEVMEVGDHLHQTQDDSDPVLDESQKLSAPAALHVDTQRVETSHPAEPISDARSSNTQHDESILDGSNDSATLFETVNQQDDLQQIFGIGPVTEKALNDLGITSYSQLAELKHHEIQKIADALEIVPGRIERDNWVGNARRQLEEVLEQL